jgi:hypothetical protein
MSIIIMANNGVAIMSIIIMAIMSIIIISNNENNVNVIINNH